jgi:hypothetical protein
LPVSIYLASEYINQTKSIMGIINWITVLAMVAILPMGVSSADSPPVPVTTGTESYRGSARVRFEAASTLHGFEGTLPTVPLDVALNGGQQLSTVAGVNVKEMNTNNEKRDKDMRTMFGLPRFEVRVSGASLTAARPQGGKQGTLPVTVILGSKMAAFDGATSNLVETPTGGSFDLELNVSLAKLGLKPPTLAFGAVKVKDNVRVIAHVKLEKAVQVAKSTKPGSEKLREPGTDPDKPGGEQEAPGN